MLNNPYVPGDPYSYDLKWLVAKVKEILAQLGTLDEAIEAKIFEGFLEHSIVQFKTVPEMLAADITDGSIVLTLGYHEAGDQGSLFYLVKDFNPDQCSLDYFLTLDNNKQIAIPVIVTPYVTPEMFGAYGDDTNDDREAFDKALTYQVPVVAGNKTYYLGSSLTVPYSTGLFGAGQESTILHFIAGAGLIIQGRNAEVANMYLKGGASGNGIDFASTHASLASIHDLTINGFTNGMNADDYIWNCAFKNIRLTDCSLGLRLANGGFCLTYTNVLIFNCTKVFTLAFAHASFTGCNFGLRATSPSCELSGAIGQYTFTDCNFEHDEQSNAPNGAIVFNGGATEFNRCNFQRDLTATSYLFGFPGGAINGVVFNFCQFREKSTNLCPGTSLINAPTGTNDYGFIQFNSTPQSALDFFGQTALPTWNKMMVMYNGLMQTTTAGAVQLQKMLPGQSVFLTTPAIMAYYNGTHLVDYNGTVLA